MREGTVADESRPRIERQVRDLTDEARCLAQFLQALGTKDRAIEFQLEIGNHGAKVCIAASLSVTVDGSLHVHRAGGNGCQSVCNCEFAIVVAMYTKRHLYLLRHFARHPRDCLRQTSAVGVTQYDPMGSPSGGA